MLLRTGLRNTATLGGLLVLLAIGLLGNSLLIALGLWLVGVPLNWSIWHTYAGLVVLSVSLSAK